MTAFLTAATAILGAPFVAGLCFIGACAVGYVARIDAIARRRKNPYMVPSLDRSCTRHHESGAPCSCQTAFRGEQ